MDFREDGKKRRENGRETLFMVVWLVGPGCFLPNHPPPFSLWLTMHIVYALSYIHTSHCVFFFFSTSCLFIFNFFAEFVFPFYSKFQIVAFAFLGHVASFFFFFN